MQKKDQYHLKVRALINNNIDISHKKNTNLHIYSQKYFFIKLFLTPPFI